MADGRKPTFPLEEEGPLEEGSESSFKGQKLVGLEQYEAQQAEVAARNANGVHVSRLTQTKGAGSSLRRRRHGLCAQVSVESELKK